MVFDLYTEAGFTTANQPIGSDGEFIFVTSNVKVIKLDTNLLINEMSYYNYINDPVSIPNGALLKTYNIVQEDVLNPMYSHSIITDANNVFLAMTTTLREPSSISYDFHVLKLTKQLEYSGKVRICRTTDDITQDENYLYLAPEGDMEVYFGEPVGIIAIRKTSLQIKLLKPLNALSNNNGTSAYGVKYFGDYIAVQLILKETIIIDTANVGDWSLDLPIGFATVAVFTFTLNNQNMIAAPNEIGVSTDGIIHACNWSGITICFKFLLPGIDLLFKPVVESHILKYLVNSTTIGGTILSPGSSDVTMVGLRYGTASNNLDQIISFENPSINFQSVLNLTPGIYYFQAYAANSVGTSYGAIVPFVVGNTVILSHDSAGAAASLRNNNCGHAVSFVSLGMGCCRWYNRKRNRCRWQCLQNRSNQ